MKNLFVTLALCLSSTALFADGMITKTSTHSVKDTLDKLETIVTEKGFKIVARVDHAGSAEKNGFELRPTEVLIFGNPMVGSKLMQSNQSIGLDLPIKVVAWEDTEGVVHIGYNDPSWMVTRHNITDKAAVVEKMTGALGKFTDAATN